MTNRNVNNTILELAMSISNSGALPRAAVPGNGFAWWGFRPTPEKALIENFGGWNWKRRNQS